MPFLLSIEVSIFKGQPHGGFLCQFRVPKMMLTGLSQKTLTSCVEFCFAGDNSRTTHHITRLAMYRELGGYLREESKPGKMSLSIYGSRHLANIDGLGNCEILEADYPKENIMKLSYPDNTFGFCLSDQVLEHVEGDPFDAVAETVRVLKFGGFVVHTSCFINEIHAFPGDCWRYTPAGLEMLVEKSGCEVIKVGGWGNEEAWALIKLGFRFRPIPNNPNNPIYEVAVHNEPLIPISTWIIGRKIEA